MLIPSRPWSACRRFEALWYIFSLSLRFRKVVRRRAALSKRLEGAAELLLDAVEGDRRGLEELAKSMDVRREQAGPEHGCGIGKGAGYELGGETGSWAAGLGSEGL